MSSDLDRVKTFYNSDPRMARLESEIEQLKAELAEAQAEVRVLERRLERCLATKSS